jgi:hypothetical protein
MFDYTCPYPQILLSSPLEPLRSRGLDLITQRFITPEAAPLDLTKDEGLLGLLVARLVPTLPEVVRTPIYPPLVDAVVLLSKKG